MNDSEFLAILSNRGARHDSAVCQIGFAELTARVEPPLARRPRWRFRRAPVPLSGAARLRWQAGLRYARKCGGSGVERVLRAEEPVTDEAPA